VPIRTTCCAALLVTILSAQEVARATAAAAPSATSLTAGADRVVRATVSDVRSQWDAARMHIYTDVTLRVEEAYKGTGARVVHVRHLGGTVDGVAMLTVGESHFDRNEEVLVFLRRNPDPKVEVYQVVAMARGKFHVERGGGNAQTQGADGPRDEARVVGAGGARVLADFEREVRTAAASEQ
jgi:hypothetical protein